MRQQSERRHCPVVIADPIAAAAREAEKDRAIFPLTLCDCRNAVALWTASQKTVAQTSHYDAKVTAFANCLTADNATAPKPNGDRMVATLRATKVVVDSDFGDQLVKSPKRFNDALATLPKPVKFAVWVAEGSNDFRGVVNSPKQRKQTLLCCQRPLTYSVGCANLSLGLLHCVSPHF